MTTLFGFKMMLQRNTSLTFSIDVMNNNVSFISKLCFTFLG